ncbi:Pvc16 family protein [Kitasatospora sp. NPDC056327]|uniref:Pvc16 family protein n=1 Tax=Kitasatospora sp. NPDC056327 TaxID=3345785 RepID=UPI0035DDB419
MSELPDPVTVDMVDFSLARLMATDKALEEVHVSLGTPKKMAEGGASPLINVYLYRFQEDVQRREVGAVVLSGREADRPRSIDPPRYAELGYMISVFSKGDEDKAPFPLKNLDRDYRSLESHKIFQKLLTLLASADELPLYLAPAPTPVGRSAYHYGSSALLRLNEPSQDVRSSGEMWSALGVPPRPFLDVSVTVPLLPGMSDITTGTWATSLDFGIVPHTDPVDVPSDRTMLEAGRLPPPELDIDSVTVTGHSGQRRITFTGRIPGEGSGARTWLSENDVRLSDLTVTVLSPDGRFRATGAYPDGDAQRVVHAVAVTGRASRTGTVLVDSLEATMITAPVAPEPAAD